ncbi:SWI/SNF complex subunit SWI3C [Argentina anserina]|uniref:SWI/SNF complex subunit SWI3C n=1 Tax=Argentina anserina TaxID=57926 RepID=UPI00217649F1|nr:SWI/SNF complex subunit SWI3C [Potentilla anserina]
MPASPSFPSSDGRGKWRKRKRDPQIRRRPRDNDDEDDDDPAAADDTNNLDPADDSDPAASDPAPHETEVLDGGVRHQDFPPVVLRTVNRPHSSVLAIAAVERANHIHSSGDGKGPVSPLVLENVSYGQLQALSAVPADCASLDQDRPDGASSSYVVTPPAIMEGRGVVKRYGNRVHVVPMHADWFSPGTVHRLERQVVPHFFSGKSPEFTPEMYMQSRNEIVAKYMENPEKRLTVPDCTNLSSHLNNEDLTRIVRFLDHWGIINYSAVTPSPEPWNGNSYLREEQNGEIHVPSAALKSIDSLIKFDKPRCRLKASDVYKSLSCHGDDDDPSDLDNIIRKRLCENHCNYCSSSLPSVCYQSQKEVDVLLCSNCFHEGRYVVGHSSVDFIRVDSTKDYDDLDGENWTDQETLLLLEAMEIYNENWNEIAEHVGTKSKAQCILHFLRLPVEDGLLENIEVPGIPLPSNSSHRDDHGGFHPTSNGNSAGPCLQDGDSESRFPFANSGNPVMSLVAFLASSVGPRVAASCAHAALAVLSEDNGLSTSGSNLHEGAGGHRMNLESMHGQGGALGNTANSVQQKGENSAGQGSWGTNEAGATPIPAQKVKAAAKAGLAAAAIKAKLFADHEEREIQRLSANIVNHQLKRLELKLKQFAEVETYLMKECEQVEKTRQRMVAERTRLISTRFGPGGVAPPMNLAGAGPSMANNNTGTNRQQIMSSSASQPSVSGYSNSQPVHSQMPFMPQQSMLGLGPRMPLASIQSSSSAPNAMFNSSGSGRPALNHPMLRPVQGTSSGLG